MKYIEEAQVQDRKALIRVDFNVPLDENLEVTDDRRIREAIPTIKHILDNGGSCILMSHLGRPKENEDKFNLKHTLGTLKKYVDVPIHFAEDCISDESFELSANLKPGEILVLNNLRYYKEEKKGDEAFAEKLSKHGDYWVNDAFGTAHRAHASTAVISKFFEEKYCGKLLQKEIEFANKVLNSDDRPICAIMGGAKVSDKITIIENLLEKVDYLLIGGGMAYTFLRAKGYNIGTSLLELEKVPTAAALIKKANQKHVKLLTPVDSVVSSEFGENGTVKVVRNEDFPSDMMGLDIGPATFEYYYDTIMASKIILWNGPMGVFEMEKFATGTNAVAKAIVEATDKGAFTLIGGGDSAAAISKAGLEDKVSYVSTGGGAMLEFLEGKTLPGIAALD
ncbi:MAG: phosphoglycerate kinase [Bacteroidia bacterium]|nr:phosphoglycerate kinase [Bacteroidia bacterium]